MAKRDPCQLQENPSWTGNFIGDCNQHLKLKECPVVSGVKITFGGAAYYSKPVAIISGDTGGSYATGFYGYGLLNKNGYVTGLEIINSGWHFTQTPTILFSGNFKSGVGGSAQNYDCSGKDWDDKNCICSGSGIILGHKIWTNVTKVPPQCSPAYFTDWTTGLVGDNKWPDCSSEVLELAQTDTYGRCLMPLESGWCVTTWESGWTEDCSNGAWQKSNNYCYEKGTSAPWGRCVGNWFNGGPTAVCGPEVHQEWQETDQFLDWGVCKKRGFKNAVAFKSWHGEPPFTSKYKCLPQTSGDFGYTVKYLTANGVWTYDMSWSNIQCPSCETNGFAIGVLGMTANVGRYDGKVTILENYSYSANNWGDELIGGYLLGFGNCIPNFLGYTGQNIGEDGITLWNAYSGYREPNGLSEDGTQVSTELTVTGTSYTFIQEITKFAWTRHCHPGFDWEGNCLGYYDLQHDFHFYSKEVITVSLSSPYTYSGLNEDADELLNQWNFLDDVIYPWKVTDSTFTMPKISRCEASPASPLDGLTAVLPYNCSGGKSLCSYSYSAYEATITWDDCTQRPDWPQPPSDWTGDACAEIDFTIDCEHTIDTPYCVLNCIEDGRIVGGPAEIGHFGTINFNHDNREDLCCSCNCDTFNADLTRSFGAQSAMHHATQWPNEREKRLLYFGGFAAINDSSDEEHVCSIFSDATAPLIPYDVLVKGKYAEIIQMDKPSRNFRMPCGIGSSGDLTLINTEDSSVLSHASATYSGNCATPCLCDTINVGETYECYACTGEGELGQRWTGFGLKASGCSTVLDVISGVSTTSGVEVVISGIYTGELGDYVNGYFTLGDPNIVTAGTFKISEIISSSGLELSGTFPFANEYISGWVDFAQNEDWFDNRPKGDFVIRGWNYPTFAGETPTRQNADPWLSGQTVTGGCIPWQACDPSIVMIVPPNSIEQQTSGEFERNLFLFETPYLIPQPWGARFHYLPQQWMVDPIWTPPSMPCCFVNAPDRAECQPPEDGEQATTVYHEWEEDDGTCKLIENEYSYGMGGGVSVTRHHYYPMRPFVEARVTGLSSFSLPSGTCAYPTGFLIYLTGACWTVEQLEALDTGTYNYINTLYGGKLCPICTPPTAGEDYWGQYAPWLVSTYQEICIGEVWPKTDGNEIKGYEGR